MSNILDHKIPFSRLQIPSQNSSHIKKNIKISQRRLPQDFFCIGCTSCVRKIPRSLSRHQVVTQTFKRANPEDDSRRQTMTARDKKDQINKHVNLIMDVLSNSKEIKKVFGKNSLNSKNSSKKYFSTPTVNLPSLFVKKGFTYSIC